MNFKKWKLIGEVDNKRMGWINSKIVKGKLNSTTTTVVITATTKRKEIK